MHSMPTPLDDTPEGGPPRLKMETIPSEGSVCPPIRGDSKMSSGTNDSTQVGPLRGDSKMSANPSSAGIGSTQVVAIRASSAMSNGVQAASSAIPRSTSGKIHFAMGYQDSFVQTRTGPRTCHVKSAQGLKYDKLRDEVILAKQTPTTKTKQRQREARLALSWHSKMWIFLGVSTFLGAAISIALLLPNKPEGGWLRFGPRITMDVGNDLACAIFLAISRITAYMMYPCVIVVFTSKAHCLRTWLWSTQLRLLFPSFPRLHDVHTRAGWLCLILTYLHSIFHIARWGVLETLEYLYNQQTGVTGFIGWMCLTLVCLPMGLEVVKKRIRYEVRKGLHIVCGIGFGVAAALHAPATNVLKVYGVVVAIYVLDWFFANVVKTYHLHTCHFTRLTDSVVLQFTNPPGFDHSQHGYVNVCVPFVSPYEWHAISVFPVDENTSALVIAKAGDWSRKLHHRTQWKTNRPCWIEGPFLTPFAFGVEYDNAICVSSGSGVSASLASIQGMQGNRRVNFIWLCRDASMVEFFLDSFDFDDHAYSLIFYTGKQKLCLKRDLPPTVLIFEERPDLRNVVSMIICSIESGNCLPESIVHQSELAEQNMRDNASEIRSIESVDDPLELLRLLVGRSLKIFTEAEMQAKLMKCRERMEVVDLEEVLLDLAPGAKFAPEAIKELATVFKQQDDSSEFISGEKLLASLKDAVQSFANDGVKVGMTPSQQPLETIRESGSKHQIYGSPANATSRKDLTERFSSKRLDGDHQLADFLGQLSEKQANLRLDRWVVMYCGGSAMVADPLQKICKDFGVAYEQEKFNW
jgi:hypothetical protein